MARAAHIKRTAGRWTLHLTPWLDQGDGWTATSTSTSTIGTERSLPRGAYPVYSATTYPHHGGRAGRVCVVAQRISSGLQKHLQVFVRQGQPPSRGGYPWRSQFDNLPVFSFMSFSQ
eukprot:scaffold174296_cov47-Prasinocladus_malaysianus.AAC.1